MFAADSLVNFIILVLYCNVAWRPEGETKYGEWPEKDKSPILSTVTSNTGKIVNIKGRSQDFQERVRI